MSAFIDLMKGLTKRKESFEDHYLVCVEAEAIHLG